MDNWSARKTKGENCSNIQKGLRVWDTNNVQSAKTGANLPTIYQH